jgi:hypothetical protein
MRHGRPCPDYECARSRFAPFGAAIRGLRLKVGRGTSMQHICNTTTLSY